MGLLNLQKDYPAYRLQKKNRHFWVKMERPWNHVENLLPVWEIASLPVFLPKLLSIYCRNGLHWHFMLCQKGHFPWLWHSLTVPCGRVEGRRFGFVFCFIYSVCSPRPFIIPPLRFDLFPFSFFCVFFLLPCVPSHPSLSFLLQCSVPRATVLITPHVSAALYFCHPAPAFFCCVASNLFGYAVAVEIAEGIVNWCPVQQQMAVKRHLIGTD